MEERDDVASGLMDGEDNRSVIGFGQGNKALYHVEGIERVKACEP